MDGFRSDIDIEPDERLCRRCVQAKTKYEDVFIKGQEFIITSRWSEKDRKWEDNKILKRPALRYPERDILFVENRAERDSLQRKIDYIRELEEQNRIKMVI